MEKNVINAPSGGVFPIYYNITWGGVRPIYYDITWGGSGQFITILHGGGGGSGETPKLYYVIYEQPLT